MRAMILAAGRGERLRPLTDRVAKPLVEVGGQSLIVRHLRALAGAGIDQIVINVSWLAEQIMQTLGDGSRWGVEIRYSVEPPGALETAGGISRALPLLDSPLFLAVSADVLCDFDYGRLIGLQPEGLAHLVMVDNPAHHPMGDFALDAAGRLHAAEGNGLTYSGIGLFRSRMFESLDPDQPMPLRPLLDRAIQAGQLSGQHHPGRWMDIGTPERLAGAQDRGW